MKRKHILLVISCMVLIFGNFTITSEAVISDGAHGGNPRFFFLPPMVPNPNPSGEFDSSLSPVVQICEWTGSECPDCNCPVVIAEFTTTGGPGSETVRVAQDEHYIVNWHTAQFNLDEKKTYRIRVLVTGIELGHADVVVVTSGQEVKSVDKSEFIPVVKGRTLPIKFWIGREEVGWTLHTNSADPVIASVPTDGGEILQFLADKDEDGRPLRLVGVRRFDPSDPDVADVLTFGENRLPDRVLLRDGSLVIYEYPSETHAVMTIVLPDGNSAKTSFDLNVPSSSSAGSTNAAEPGTDVDKSFALEGTSMPLSESALAAETVVILEVRVRAESGGVSYPVTEALVSGCWSVVGGTQEGSFIAKHQGGGRYRSEFPFTPEVADPALIQELCEKFADLVGDVCSAAQDSGFSPAAAAGCLGFLAIPVVGEALAAACEAAVVLLVATCNAETACKLLKMTLDVVLDPEKPILVNVHVNTGYFHEDQSQNIPPPMGGFMGGELLEFEFVFPFSIGLSINPPDPAPGQGYVATTNTYPPVSGLPVTMSIVGTDGYSKSRSGLTNEQGEFYLTVPGAEAGVIDCITTTVDGQTKTVSIVF